MKKRNINYIKRQKAFREMFQFKDIKSFLIAGFHTSKSLVVKKDILETLLQLNKQGISYAA